ncbi:hypothetical protein BELL_1252g00020 [Botrytis elliptica]|uniref:non-specific serine/threonine protein kinase n=1 Tax=Botrytis elliptica TaxID=278938 RepID=A0A4Z1IJC1_9HELO|nr:hypothetical protein BELL_1252g00020 [Botrytis elliptica]
MSQALGIPRSQSITAPNTPEPEPEMMVDTIEVNGDFARLIPQNRLAQEAFNEIVLKMKDVNAGFSSHAAKFIHVDGLRSEEPVSFSESDSVNTGTDTGTSLWTGFYRLNLNLLPGNPLLGWIIGTGRDLRPADFVICKQGAHHVHGRHARLTYHEVSGALLIQSDKRSIIIDGKDNIVNNRKALLDKKTGITLGDLSYVFEYTNLNKTIYFDQLNRFRQQLPNASDLPSFVDPTPSAKDFILNDYLIKDAFAQGSTCSVHIAIHRTVGSYLVAKKVHRNNRNQQRIKAEVEILKSFEPHPRICQLQEVIYPGKDQNVNHMEVVDEVYMMFSSVAEENLGNIIKSGTTLPDQIRITIFQQCISGVAFIHQQGVMHRDLKPANIGLLSVNPPKAILLDFGVATRESESNDHYAGTIPYLAPEIIALKNNTARRFYNISADIWSLGVTVFQLIHGELRIWEQINKKTYEQAHSRLANTSGDDEKMKDFKRLVGRMMKWESRERITASRALEDQLFLREEGERSNKEAIDVAGKRRQGEGERIVDGYREEVDGAKHVRVT